VGETPPPFASNPSGLESWEVPNAAPPSGQQPGRGRGLLHIASVV
jgi:hypothetical protein